MGPGLNGLELQQAKGPLAGAGSTQEGGEHPRESTSWSVSYLECPASELSRCRAGAPFGGAGTVGAAGTGL